MFLHALGLGGGQGRPWRDCHVLGKGGQGSCGGPLVAPSRNQIDIDRGGILSGEYTALAHPHPPRGRTLALPRSPRALRGSLLASMPQARLRSLKLRHARLPAHWLLAPIPSTAFKLHAALGPEAVAASVPVAALLSLGALAFLLLSAIFAAALAYQHTAARIPLISAGGKRGLRA